MRPRSSWHRRLLAVPVCLFLLSFTAPSVAAADSNPVQPKRLFAVSKPATVLVLADFKAHVTVPEATISDNQLEALKNRAVGLILAGQLSSDQNAIIAWMVDQILTDPLTYFVPTGTLRSADVELVGQGSGFVISPDGYVLTNAHVAAPNEDVLKAQLAEKGLKTFIDQDVQEFVKEAGGNVPKPVLDKVTQAATKFDRQYLRLAKLDKSFFIAEGVAIPGVGSGSKNIPAEMASAGQQTPGKDVAVLKVERKDLPTLPLGQDSQVSTGDKVYVIGYPAAATFHPALSDQSQIEPSLTTGTVSAKKTMPGGFPVLQIDAPITHGNSGGPVFDGSGKVIGIATFGSIDPSTGAEIQGFNFAMPISVANEFISKAGAKPEQSLVSKKYSDAIDLYDKEWYSDALAEFQQVNTLSPGHPYVQEYITNSQTAIAQGKDKTWQKYVPFAIAAALVLALLVGGLVLLLVLRARRGRAATKMAGRGITYGPQAPAYPARQLQTGRLPEPGQAPQGWSAPGPGVVSAGSTQPAAARPGGEPQPPGGRPGPSPAGEPPGGPTESSTVNFCPNCGNSVSGKVFCDRCGTRIAR